MRKPRERERACPKPPTRAGYGSTLADDGQPNPGESNNDDSARVSTDPIDREVVLRAGRGCDRKRREHVWRRCSNRRAGQGTRGRRGREARAERGGEEVEVRRVHRAGGVVAEVSFRERLAARAEV